jgi:cobalt-zinc-cadmium efflux system outer membrane protein
MRLLLQRTATESRAKCTRSMSAEHPRSALDASVPPLFTRHGEAGHGTRRPPYQEQLKANVVRLCTAGALAGWFLACAAAQTPLTWQQVKDQFVASNPTLLAGQLGIQESKAEEITAYLKPNPNMTASIDQINPFAGYTGAGGESVYRPFSLAFPSLSFSYLYERNGKRELRRESARQGTTIAESQLADTERNLLFNLRSAFIQTLQAKAVLALAQENLEYFNHEIAISRDRFKAGDLARVDLNRLELQRVQYEQDYQTARVNL